MSTFNFEVVETYSCAIEVKADSYDEALAKVRSDYENKQTPLDFANYEINYYGEVKTA